MSCTLSPPGRRRPLAPVASALLLLGVVAALTTACGSDGGEGADTAQAADTTPVTDTRVEDSAPGDTADTSGGCVDGAPCDDGDPCTEDDRCDAAGACRGAARSCDDGLACTHDSCRPDGACVSAVVAGFCLGGANADACVADGSADPSNSCRICQADSGAGPGWGTLPDGEACSDGDACTTEETCSAGVCTSVATLDCASSDPCITGTCDALLGCVTAATTAPCDDGDPCTVGDVCADRECKPGAGTLSCDDGDACTVDACVAGLGCDHDPNALCDDHDPCTRDSCLPGGNCQNTPFTGPCDDGNPCTVGEACDVNGQCVGGSANSCDDDNPCTLDSCHPLVGCLNLFETGSCDDAEQCTTNDQCVAGACFGVKTGACPECTIERTELANKIVSIELASDGNKGSGIDVDQDLNTCAPSTGCSGGVDNALAVLAFLVNPSIASSVDTGVVKWVIDLREARTDGEEFRFAVYDSGLTDASELAGCDFQHDTCEYEVAQLSLNAQCRPYFVFDNARIVNGELFAGGNQSLISMVLPLQGGDMLSLTIAWARVNATFTTDAGGRIVSMNAVLGGAVPKAQLIAAISGLSSSALPIDREDALALLEVVVQSDIDLDGDGIKESASLGMRVNSIPAIIAN